MRRPVIGVMGSGKEGHETVSIEVGVWLARDGYHLLTGGGDGVMKSVSKAFYEVSPREGQVIGIVPSCENDPICRPKVGYPNQWVEIVIYTHLPFSGKRGMEPLSRNHINVLSSDVLILLPGGPGTMSEAQLGIKYKKPIIALARSNSECSFPPQVNVVETLAEVKSFVYTHVA